ncbi:Phytochrome-like protein cph2 [compost metagenome]
MGQALKNAAIRPRDFVARFGGEEFVLILPATDEPAARQVAERCRKLIRERCIPHEKSAIASLLTISLGVGTISPGQQDRPLPFIEAVDRLLYQAKQRGRNRLESARWGSEATIRAERGEGH